MSDVLAFWLAALVIGALGVPITNRLFRRFPDSGAGLAFTVGLVLTSYGYFILRVFSVLPFGRGGYVLAVGLLAIVSTSLVANDRHGDWRSIAQRWPAYLAAAGLFTAAYFGAVAVRSQTPDISGTEQPMDFLFLNATLSSPAYPPEDPWLADERVSYYYFGYIQVGVLTSVSGAPASTGYNLGLAYTFAATATAAASVAYALGRWMLPRRRRQWIVAAAPAAAWMLLLSGSLIAVFEWSAAHGHAPQALFEWLGLEYRISCSADARDGCYNVTQQARTMHWYPDQFFYASYFSMTRHIPGTIVEFPIFSFLLGDLHPHVTAIPLVIVTIAVSAATWRGRGVLDWRSWRVNPIDTLFIAVLFGALAFQNAFDAPTFSFLFALAVLVRNLAAAPPVKALKSSAGYLTPIAFIAVAAYIPWYRDFSSQASGLYPYIGAGTTPSQVFLQWGPLVVSGLLPLFALKRTDMRSLLDSAPFTLWIPLLPLATWAALASYHGQLAMAMENRSAAGWWTLFLYSSGIFLLSTGAMVLALRRSFIALPAALAALGILLLYGTELLLIRDAFFGSPFVRMNTVFKLTYQAWILMSLAGGASIAYAFSRRTVSASSAALASVALIGAAGVYALTGIPNRTSGFGNESSPDGLYGLARFDPDEYALTEWVIANVPPGDIVVEATGRTWRIGEGGAVGLGNQPGDQSIDYTDSGRIAFRTGRPGIVGWPDHERQWRGYTPELIQLLQERQAAVDAIYIAGGDSQAVLETLRRYGAKYLVVGRVEQAKYPPSTLPDFASFLDPVFESGGLRIYAVPVTKVVPTS